MYEQQRRRNLARPIPSRDRGQFDHLCVLGDCDVRWIEDYVERIAERVAYKAVNDEREREPRVWLWRPLGVNNVWRVSMVPIKPNTGITCLEVHCVRMSEFFELMIKASGKELVIHPEETKKLQIELRDSNEKT